MEDKLKKLNNSPKIEFFNIKNISEEIIKITYKYKIIDTLKIQKEVFNLIGMYPIQSETCKKTFYIFLRSDKLKNLLLELDILNNKNSLIEKNDFSKNEILVYNYNIDTDLYKELGNFSEFTYDSKLKTYRVYSINLSNFSKLSLKEDILKIIISKKCMYNKLNEKLESNIKISFNNFNKFKSFIKNDKVKNILKNHFLE